MDKISGDNIEISHNEADDDIFDELLDEQQKAADKSEEEEIVEHERELEEEEEKSEAAGDSKKSSSRRKRKQPIKVVDKEKGEEGDEPAEEEEESEEEGAEEEKKEEEDEPEAEKKEAGASEEGTEDADVGKKLSEEEFKKKLDKELKAIPPKEAIKGTIVKRAAESHELDRDTIASGVPLRFLEDEAHHNVFIGRKKAFLQKYGYEGALYIGKVMDKEHQGKQVYLDSLNPHVIFVCGARGSGKSYVMGVIAEEIARNNENVGVVVIDPVGVFWSMKYPNKEEREIKAMADWNIEPEGLDNLRVFIPEGMKEKTPKTTYDATFSIPPLMLTSEDWALTFGIERFSPTGLLLEIALKKVHQGYTTVDGTKVKAKEYEYSLDDIIDCLQSDSVLHSKDRGYKADSIRALSSRFEAAKSWGIFSANGTPLSELSSERQLTVIDTSFLDDSVTALVIGILARRILAARKITTRKEAAKKFKTKDVDELLELDIPPTWLFIDEAHMLIPSGNVNTPATSALVEYVKQGRRPGCSLVFATQQPSAIDTKVLSQLDILISHKLVFDDDIKAVNRRTPTIVPIQYKKPSFIKTLPIGSALTADRNEQTSRAFIMKIRPRMSQHEGREAEAHDRSGRLSKEDLGKLIAQLIFGKLKKERVLTMAAFEELLARLNKKYRADIAKSDILNSLVEKGAILDEDKIMMPRYAEPEPEEEAVKTEEPEMVHPPEEVEKEEHERTELLTLPVRVDKKQVFRIANSQRKKGFLGIFGSQEYVKDVMLRYATVWKIKYDAFNERQEFVQRECFVDSLSGEFLHFSKNRFIRSQGLSAMQALTDDAARLLNIMMHNKLSPEKLKEKTGFSETKLRNLLDRLSEQGFLIKATEKGKVVYSIKKKVDLPPSPTHDLLSSLNNLPLTRVSAVSMKKERFDKKQAISMLKRLWPNIVVKQVEEIYRPVYDIAFSGPEERKIRIDGITGEQV